MNRMRLATSIVRAASLRDATQSAARFQSTAAVHQGGDGDAGTLRGVWGFLGRLLVNNLAPAEKRTLAQALYNAPAPAPVVRTVEVVKEVERIVQRDTPEEPEHPILGKLLHDFGAKRVYAMRPAMLCNQALVPVWNLQRSFRLDRAETIAKAKKADPALGFPGVITVYEFPAPNSGFRAILDGQHRVGALRLLQQKGLLDSPEMASFQRVLVEVFRLESEAAAEALFIEINQARPMLLVDMPASGGGAGMDTKAILEAAAQELCGRYPEMFSPSLNCKAPHLNIDSLRDKLFQVDALAMHKLESGGQLVAWMLAHNDRLAKRADEEWLAQRPGASGKTGEAAFKKALQKARLHGFFLGLDSWNWLHIGPTA